MKKDKCCVCYKEISKPKIIEEKPYGKLKFCNECYKMVKKFSKEE